MRVAGAVGGEGGGGDGGGILVNLFLKIVGSRRELW